MLVFSASNVFVLTAGGAKHTSLIAHLGFYCVYLCLRTIHIQKEIHIRLTIGWGCRMVWHLEVRVKLGWYAV